MKNGIGERPNVSTFGTNIIITERTSHHVVPHYEPGSVSIFLPASGVEAGIRAAMLVPGFPARLKISENESRSKSSSADGFSGSSGAAATSVSDADFSRRNRTAAAICAQTPDALQARCASAGVPFWNAAVPPSTIRLPDSPESSRTPALPASAGLRARRRPGRRRRDRPGRLRRMLARVSR